MSIDEMEQHVRAVGSDIIEARILPDEDMWRLQKTPIRRRAGPEEGRSPLNSVTKWDFICI